MPSLATWALCSPGSLSSIEVVCGLRLFALADTRRAGSSMTRSISSILFSKTRKNSLRLLSFLIHPLHLLDHYNALTSTIPCM